MTAWKKNKKPYNKGNNQLRKICQMRIINIVYYVFRRKNEIEREYSILCKKMKQKSAKIVQKIDNSPKIM